MTLAHWDEVDGRDVPEAVKPLGGRWQRVLEDHPWQGEAKLGLPDGEPAERPANVVALADAEDEYGGAVKLLGRSAGAKRTGLPGIRARTRCTSGASAWSPASRALDYFDGEPA